MRSYYTIPVEDEIPEDDIVPEDVVVTTGSYTYDYRGNVLTETHDGYSVREKRNTRTMRTMQQATERT